MKTKSFLLAGAAVLMALSSCNKAVDYGPANISADKSSYELTKDAQSVSVALTATIDWQAKVDTENADWLDISPVSGTPSLQAQTLTVKVTENTGFDREASILIQGDVLHKTYVNIKQLGAKGDSNVATQVTVKEFIDNADTERKYILEGTISDIANSTSYYGFELTDATGTVDCAFPTNFSDYAASLKDGGTVKIQGNYSFYEKNQEAEMLNGEILSYVAPAPVDPSKLTQLTVQEFLNRADTKTNYKLVGTVNSFKDGGTYWSFNLKDDTGSIYVYSVESESMTSFAGKVSNGKKVTLYGKYYVYNNTTVEIKNATIVSVEEGEGSGEQGGSVEAPTQWTVATIAEFLAAEVSTEKWYQLTGEITSITNTIYGTLKIKDSTGEVQVYGLTKTFCATNDKSFASIGLKKGDTVTLRGLRSEHEGTPETADAPPAFYVSHVAGQGSTYPAGSVILTFPDDNKNSNKVNDYVSEWTAKSGTNEFKMANFNNYEWNGWAYVKAGRKSAASVASISTSAAISAKIAKVILVVDSITASDVNSIKLVTASDSGFTKDTAESSVTPATGNLTFTIATPAKDLYYKIVVDCKTSSKSKNGFVQISEVDYVAAE